MALNLSGPLRPPPEGVPPPADEGRRSTGYVAACLALAAVAGLASVILLAARGGAPAPAASLPPLQGRSPPEPVASPAPVAPPGPAAPARPPPRPARAPPPAEPPFVQALRRAGPGSITLQVEDDPAARAYAARLKALFEQAGWTVGWRQAIRAGAPAYGLRQDFGDGPAADALRRAFAAAGVALGPPPENGLVRRPELVVGAPPPPWGRRSVHRVGPSGGGTDGPDATIVP